MKGKNLGVIFQSIFEKHSFNPLGIRNLNLGYHTISQKNYTMAEWAKF
jgi:hypothetical protein